MPKLKRMRLVSRLARSPFAYVTLLILAALFISSAVSAYGKNRVAKKRMQEAESALAELKNQKDKLSNDFENANTAFGEEKALREKFNVVREGEKVIMIIPETQVAASAETVNEGGRFFRFFRKIFKK